VKGSVDCQGCYAHLLMQRLPWIAEFALLLPELEAPRIRSRTTFTIVPQQPVMHAGFFTSGRGSPPNMFRFGILIALNFLASSVPFAENNPFRLRM
jgi:hypothetical protein